MPRLSASLPRIRPLLLAALGLCVLLREVRADDPPSSSERSIDWEKARQFWAFQPPRALPRPEVRDRHWPRQPLDWFVLERLENAGLEPAPEADRPTLLRRVTLDLTGLPPTPEAASDFVGDPRPDAYERVVDRLLASPRFGERLASLWLPLARYAEDQAHQVGQDTTMFYPRAHRYREWVIGAFNRDLPYDRFLSLQLAADTLGAGPEDLAALGFLGLGPKYYDRGRLAVMADEWEDRVDTVTRTLLGLTVGCARCHDHKLEPITMTDYYGLAGVFASTRMVNRGPDGKPVEGKVEAAKMPEGTLHVVEEGQATDLNLFRRGNVDDKGPLVERRFLRVLSAGEPVRFKDGSGRRELAGAIADRANPLTARVMVNRLWAHCFGEPIVPTPSNFGHSGGRPSDAALLDDLAVRFMERGWSVKSLVAELVLSSAYRRSSGASPAGRDRRRLSVEAWRDQALFAAGELDLAAGPSRELDDPGNLRRTVHARVSRLKLDDLLMQFDYPDANVHAERRASTTTPTLKLFMLNSPFVLARAEALARRVDREAGPNDAARVSRAYRILFGRAPDAEEARLARAFLARPDSGGTPRWTRYAQALLISNEALYVD